MTNKEQKKTPFYKNKVLVIPMVALFCIALVSAGVVAYFHSVNATVIASEGRSSTDVDFTLNCFSGETVTQDLTIINLANVPLATNLVFTETANADGVVYTNDLPMKVTTGALSTGTYTVSFECDEVTPAGTVTGVITYNPVAI